MTVPDLIEVLGDAQTVRRKPHNTNRGRTFPPEPLAVEDIVRLLDACTPVVPGWHGEMAAAQLRALLVVLWRTGLRISEALALEERDLARQDLAIVVRHGKGDKRRVVAMDEWGWRELERWLVRRQELPAGPIFCVIRCAMAGLRPLSDTDARRLLAALGKRAGLTRRVNPHCFRHTCAVDLWREGIPEYVIQQQLGHARLDVTATYLRGLAPVEILERIGHRRPPMMRVPGLSA